jgi:superfamily II DNA or RNA helicase
MIQLAYDRGSILIRGATGTPYGRWDPRVSAFRAIGLHYPAILEYLTHSELDYEDHVADALLLPPLTLDLALRPYQSAALEAWVAAGHRGIIELPTGAGKTYIALQAIARLNEAALIIVPTLDLVEQWRRQLTELFQVEVGVIGGGEVVVKPLTVATYDSAYLRAEQLGNHFLLLVFDEVHHLPAPSYRQIAEMYIAPHRLGLTATYLREDGGHAELPRLVGGRVYQRAVDDLTGKHLAPYTREKLFVDLEAEEQVAYTEAYGAFTRYLRVKGLRLRGPRDFQRFIMSTGTSPAARRALLARNRAMDIALNAQAKVQRLGELLSASGAEKVLIFTRHNALVYRISRRFLIPAVTHQSGKAERRAILDAFRDGTYRAVVTSQVLDEGIDVPDASVAIIISGTGSSREYIQRLGRILRPQTGKRARLIELVTRDTVETRISTRRHRKP